MKIMEVRGWAFEEPSTGDGDNEGKDLPLLTGWKYT